LRLIKTDVAAGDMKAKDRRFDVDALQDLAGDKVFARGEAYHRDGQVAILSIGPNRVLARVAGTEDYRTELTGRGKKIGGSCSCPAFEDWGFCKHMVAAALAANEAAGTAEGDGAFARIRDYLKSKSVDSLVEMIMELAERDAALFRKLDLAAAAVDFDVKRIEATLRKAIDGATRTRGFIDYGEAGGWAAAVDEALDALADLASGKHAGLVLELADHAIHRIEQAIENIDDSDGHCTTLLERARTIHLAAARTALPEPAQFARDFFAREMADQYGTFDGAVALYAEVLGEKGLAEYRRLASTAWEKLPLRSETDGDEADSNYDCLAGILDFFAERDGDVEARIALRAKDLSSPWQYLQLAQFCLAQGRGDEALRRAEEGLWMFEDDRPDERLVFFAADLLVKSGRKRDAELHLWCAFEKAPSLDLYKRLRNIRGMAARDRALRLLEAGLERERPNAWHHPADLLIRVLIEEKLFDAAWGSVRKHGASAGLKESLARASEATHHRQALEIYAERVNQLASAGGNRAYAEAASLIVRMAGLRGASEQAAYVAELKTRFGRKRNFMRALA
jgi:uncharacterized Zn finger protein